MGALRCARVAHLSRQKKLKRVLRIVLYRLLATAKDARAFFPEQADLPAFYAQHAALPEPYDVNLRVGFDELQQSLRAGLAVVIGHLCVRVVRVDLKRHERERPEAW